MSNWRPIEEAPKDGTEILGAWYFTMSKMWCLEPVEWRSIEWVVSWDGDLAFPTHWMPLPAPPEDV